MIVIDPMRLFCRNGIYYVAYPGDVKRSLHTRNKAAAERTFRRIQKEALLGNVIRIERASNVTLFEFRDEYLKHSEASKKAPTALIDKKSFKTLCEHFGNRPLRTISVKDLDQFHDTRHRAGRKPSGINIMIRHLRSAFNTAVKWGYLTTSPYNQIKPVKNREDEEEQPPRFLADWELQKIKEKLKGEFKDIINLYLLTGMRRSELCFLLKENVDLESGRAKVYGKGVWRKVYLSSEAKEILSPRCEGKGRVFPGWHPDVLTRRWSRLIKRLGLERCRLHDLRHTTGSYLVMAGVDIRTVQEILGHTKITTTQIYSHLSKDHVLEAVDKLEKSLKSRSLPKPALVSIQ